MNEIDILNTEKHKENEQIDFDEMNENEDHFRTEIVESDNLFSVEIPIKTIRFKKPYEDTTIELSIYAQDHALIEKAIQYKVIKGAFELSFERSMHADYLYLSPIVSGRLKAHIRDALMMLESMQA